MGGLEREGVFMLALDLFYMEPLSQATDVLTVHEEATTAVEEDNSCCGSHWGSDEGVQGWKVGGDGEVGSVVGSGGGGDGGDGGCIGGAGGAGVCVKA